MANPSSSSTESSSSGSSSTISSSSGSSDSFDGPPAQLGGKRQGRRKNGHKFSCKCPICINMKHAKRSKRNRDNKRGGTKKRKQGGGEEKDELDMTSHGMDDDDESKYDMAAFLAESKRLR